MLNLKRWKTFPKHIENASHQHLPPNLARDFQKQKQLSDKKKENQMLLVYFLQVMYKKQLISIS